MPDEPEINKLMVYVDKRNDSIVGFLFLYISFEHVYFLGGTHLWRLCSFPHFDG